MSIFKPGLFKGKVVLVTGGGTGIGKAITTELRTLGCKVMIASRSEEKLKAATNELKNVGYIDIIECDIRVEEDVKQCFEENGGAIVNIIADMFRGFPMMSHTGAARAGIDNLTKELRNLKSDLTSAYLNNNIGFALKNLCGEVGAAIPFEVLKFDPKNLQFIAKCPLEFVVKFRASLTLQGTYQGTSCAYHVLKTGRNLFGLTENHNFLE